MEKLINKVKLFFQEDYRFSDIINKSGERWKWSGNMIIKKEKYNNTILKNYLLKNGLLAEVNSQILLDIIIKFLTEKNINLPKSNEIVLHLRLGDFVINNNILKKNHIGEIRNIINKNPNIKKITIVTAFSYGTWTKESLHLRKKANLWECTDDTQKKNKIELRKLLLKITRNFPNLELNIHSRSDPDIDICYCVFAKHFINDVGGFSSLLKKLNDLYKN